MCQYGFQLTSQQRHNHKKEQQMQYIHSVGHDFFGINKMGTMSRFYLLEKNTLFFLFTHRRHTRKMILLEFRVGRYLFKS